MEVFIPEILNIFQARAKLEDITGFFILLSASLIILNVFKFVQEAKTASFFELLISIIALSVSSSEILATTESLSSSKHNRLVISKP